MTSSKARTQDRLYRHDLHSATRWEPGAAPDPSATTVGDHVRASPLRNVTSPMRVAVPIAALSA